MKEKRGVSDNWSIADLGPTPCDGCVNFDICATGLACSTFRKWLYPRDFIIRPDREPSEREYGLIFGAPRRRGPKKPEAA